MPSAMSRFEGKIKNHAAKAQQRNVRSFQPAPPGPVSRTRVNGARTISGVVFGNFIRLPSRKRGRETLRHCFGNFIRWPFLGNAQKLFSGISLGWPFFALTENGAGKRSGVVFGNFIRWLKNKEPRPEVRCSTGAQYHQAKEELPAWLRSKQLFAVAF
jgi:hypothetical protein